MVKRMSNLSYWEKRHLRTKAKELQNSADYEQNLKSRLSSLEYELEQEADTWYSKYADNHDIDPETAKQYAVSRAESIHLLRGTVRATVRSRTSVEAFPKTGKSPTRPVV